MNCDSQFVNCELFQNIFHPGDIQRIRWKPCCGSHRRECHTHRTDRTGNSDWKIKRFDLNSFSVELSLVNITTQIEPDHLQVNIVIHSELKIVYSMWSCLHIYLSVRSSTKGGLTPEPM